MFSSLVAEQWPVGSARDSVLVCNSETIQKADSGKLT
jgi:hypothetical protein